MLSLVKQPPAATAAVPMRATAPLPHATPAATGNQAILRRLSATAPHLQPKLEIGAANDPLEREADRVADEVMRMADGAPARSNRTCAACEQTIRTKPAASRLVQRQHQPPDAGAARTPSGDAGAASQTTACPQPTPVCPADYCTPFPTQQEAEADRAANAESILASIRLLNGRAEPLFRKYIFDAGPAGDISSTYAQDFTNCTVTQDTTVALQQKLEAALQARPPAIPPGGSITLDITSTMSPKEITDFVECHLVFDDYTSVPGLIAGGVGKTQESEKIGKNTSGKVNDSRAAAGTMSVIQNDGTFEIVPDITYTVVDTLDFCPGNCGDSSAQRLTVPMSRWEASGISGDVPFKAVFPAPSLVGAYGSEEA